jgi:mono/diheme cytochrome c family protein
MVRGLLLAWVTVGCLAAGGRDLKAFFLERCAVCHGPDGTGKDPGGARLGGRNLRDARWLAKRTEAELAASILQGRGAMPGFRRQLGEAEARQMAGDLLGKTPKSKVRAPGEEPPR